MKTAVRIIVGALIFVILVAIYFPGYSKIRSLMSKRNTVNARIIGAVLNDIPVQGGYGYYYYYYYYRYYHPEDKEKKEKRKKVRKT